MALMVRRARDAHWYILGFLFIAAFVTAGVAMRESRHGATTVAFLDVGQGDAIFIESPTGIQVLIDAGAGRAVLRGLSEVMPWYDRSLDMVIATHGDQDHIGGFPEVFARYTIGQVIVSGLDESQKSDAAFLRAVEAEGARVIAARRGQRVVLGGGAVLEILFPDRSTAGWESNTASIVAVIGYGEGKILLTGDSPQAIEDYMVALDPKSIDADILKTGHHGSRTSTSERFVAAVSPVAAVISAGKDNRYGHPHQNTIDALQRHRVEIFSTAETGTIVAKSMGGRFEIVNKK